MKLIVLFIITLLISRDTSFLKDQLKYSRVRTAKAEKEVVVKSHFESKGIKYPSNQIYIRAFKSEALLEIWAFKNENKQYVKIKDYEICSL
jgi:murein L,D-transpeptidase YafK